MIRDESLGYWYQETSNSSYHHCNDDGISYDESIGVSTGDIRRGYRYLDTINSSYRDRGVYHSGD